MKHWVEAFHIMMMVTWFSGLFYLPRLFVYHAMTTDPIGNERFKVMERKLYFGIMTPGMLITIALGIWLISMNASYYLAETWLHLKLTCVTLLVLYHIYLGKCLFAFKRDGNTHSDKFYRILNEVPVFFLAAIVILVVVKPFA